MALAQRLYRSSNAKKIPRFLLRENYPNSFRPTVAVPEQIQCFDAEQITEIIIFYWKKFVNASLSPSIRSFENRVKNISSDGPRPRCILWRDATLCPANRMPCCDSIWYVTDTTTLTGRSRFIWTDTTLVVCLCLWVGVDNMLRVPCWVIGLQFDVCTG